MIALNSPLKPDLKKLHQYLEKVNSSGWFTNFGPLHNELTDRLEDYLGVKNLLLVSNGTVALQLAGRALGVDNLITTPFSFVATSSAFQWQKDTISFADIDRQSYNLCPDATSRALTQDPALDTILATHVYGNPCDVKGFESLGKEKNVKVIYDAAHTFGIKVGDQSVLSYGDASTLSFHATKLFHTVEGGAVVFKDKQHFEKAKLLINFGIEPDKGIVETGVNGKLNEYQAAVGLVNLERMDIVLQHRAELFSQYITGLKDVVELPKWHSEANYNGAYMPIKLKNSQQASKLITKLAESNIQSRTYFSPALDSVFTECKNHGTPNSDAVTDGVLCLPLHVEMTAEDVDKVICKIKESGVL
ncbi:MAG: DegT/DnrJ/EryC1/StrS family aminotransferase [Paraglaciecola sp.]|uniref:DegT/DnrJ/EryC1/StrS aminotransferase family protein n=1 Tax=Paraglaciecola sp. TaxID=1920173 RepID=UPI003296823E